MARVVFIWHRREPGSKREGGRWLWCRPSCAADDLYVECILWDGSPSLSVADRLTSKSRGLTLLLKSTRPVRTSCGLKCRYEAYKGCMRG
jgi:hypothetical protein